MTVKLNANEVVLKAGDTNQVIDNKIVDGKLIVTNQRIYFRTENTETDGFNLEILFENIREVIYYSKGLFSVKGLNVITTDGKCHTFPLKKRDEIGQLINKCIRAISISIYYPFITEESRHQAGFFYLYNYTAQFMMWIYSYLNETTGFLLAALMILKLIVSNVAIKIIENANRRVAAVTSTK